MARKTGLGTRGLDELLTAQRKASESHRAEELRQVPVEQIQRGRYQPRVNIRAEELQELADSISAQGVIQPVVLRRVDGGGYELIAGERRWRAAQLAGLHEVPAVVREIPDQAAAAMSLIENIQREDLNPLEEAGALARLIEEFGLTHQQVADAVGRSRAAVSNLLRLRDLSDVPRALLEAGELEMGHARAMLGLAEADQAAVARKVVNNGLNVRQTERLIKDWGKSKPAPPQASTDVRQIETDLSERLGARVKLQTKSNGNGKLVIEYNSLDELDGILAHIK
ncbi:ParB/RepB/Spo0J family partition protein [Acidihalobacter ferrooxydans]|uniref:Probable chromosome-partitioning protein ParB n=1 Tax=Acidihalobacter ferrooxydans TaxID=1765967 RepID=A0A1P8UKU0_9GAMM|nr:ParB/RepB/Spo0J family partition protein [Acidihalobacter ferrooxydans]APZ44429.1 chromosome partitioning protein ParB [Acidihalobacter ferrooxydans]